MSSAKALGNMSNNERISRTKLRRVQLNKKRQAERRKKYDGIKNHNKGELG